MHRRCYQQAASSVHYTTSCKHSLVLLRMGEIIARNMLSWLKLLIKLLLLHLVGCFHYCINDARSHEHQIFQKLAVKLEAKKPTTEGSCLSLYIQSFLWKSEWKWLSFWTSVWFILWLSLLPFTLHRVSFLFNCLKNCKTHVKVFWRRNSFVYVYMFKFYL